MLLYRLTTLTFFYPALLACAANVSKRQESCAGLEILFIPGTNADGLEDLGEAFQASVATLADSANVEALDYDTSVEYIFTVADGAGKVEAWFESKTSACPEALFAAVGYSKGAMVLHEVRLDQSTQDKMVALAVFGDPYTEDTGIVSELTGGVFEDLTNAFPINDVSGNVIRFCNKGDPFCDGGLDFNAHAAYATDGSAEDAATFIVEHYNQKAGA